MAQLVVFLPSSSDTDKMTDENKKVKIRPKSLFTFKLPKPKIVFGSVTPSIQEHEHSISAPTDFTRNASIGINKETGELDLSSVPHEFRGSDSCKKAPEVTNHQMLTYYLQNEP